MKKIALILFAFNRPYYLSHTLKSLEKNFDKDKFIFYAFIDKYQSSTDKNLNIETLSLIENSSLDFIVNYRSENYGLAKNIIHGVNEISNQHEMFVVLEDDLKLHPMFLRYMSFQLEMHKNSNEIGQIAGHNFNIRYPFTGLYLQPRMSSWGWGSWSRVWKNFQENPSLILNNLDYSEVFIINYFENINNIKGLKRQVQEKTNAYFARFYCSSVMSGSPLCVTPSFSLVQHIGVHGVHFSGSSLINPTHGKISKLNVSDYINMKPSICQENTHKMIQYFNYLNKKNKIQRIFKLLKIKKWI